MAKDKDTPMTPDEYYKKISKEDRTAVVNLAKPQKIDFIPTGSWVLNKLIGDGTNKQKPGGLPRGHIVEVFGDESSGKSTLGISACKQAQDLGGVPVFVDFEQTFHSGYAQGLGLDLSTSKFMLMRPNHFEQGARMIKDALKMKPLIIVVDSVSAMTPKAFIEGKVDEAGRIGLQAQLMSAYLSNITKSIPEANTCLLFLNQLRSRIKTQYERGPKEESSGGWALKFYSSVRLKLTNTSKSVEVDQVSQITGKKEKRKVSNTVKAVVCKNKVDTPFYTAPVHIRFGEGFDNILSIIELAENQGVIKKKGSFLIFSNDDKEEVFKVQGRENLRNTLMEDTKSYEKLTSAVIFKQDQQAKEEYKDSKEEEPDDDMGDIFEDISSKYAKKDDEGGEEE